ncbi:MAG: glycosyl hydrolase [Bacteroidetes bacterium]|nr:glycosyl hydrolase [Bacteroidota bacterium]
MRLLQTLCLLFLFALSLSAQQDRPPFTPGLERMNDYDKRIKLQDQSLVDNIPFRSVGPSVFSGRVVDIAVDPEDPTHFYVAYASGGLWETHNNGTSFSPLFDNEFVMTLGAVAVDWENNTIWLGTGEVNSSRSSYAGAGMYKSTDGGNTWTWSGLQESHHIGRILIHPDNPNKIYVAVLGHLYSPNQERGLYISGDGGGTWKRSLFVNDQAGVIDVIFDPQDPETIYAASWERSRRAWNFVESGAGSGIHKSTDGGTTWNKVSDISSGFPIGEGVGRIGLAAGVDDGETIVYAVLDNYFRRPKEEEDDSGRLTKDDFRKMDAESFLKLEDEKLEAYLRSNGFPEKHTAASVKEQVEADAIQPIALTEYVEDANSLLFDTPVIGSEVYRSTNGGRTWKRAHEDYLEDVYYSYGYYFGQIRVQADDPSSVYIMGVPVLRSKDSGKTWESINGDNVHVDHHALWVNPDRPGHLILGNDGGINISFDDGDHWIKCNSPAVGQFYAVAVDNSTPYRIFGGLQDNGVWMGPSTYEASDRWHNTGEYPYKGIMGGDGMQIAIDPRDNNTAYTGYQFGNYFRLKLDGKGRPTPITPKHELGERPLRWNWQTPIHLSVHNPDIFYMGSNKVHRSFDQGNHFEAISEDLTKGGKKGDVAFGTLTTIHESPLQFGLLYAGSDDGLIHVSKDGGHSWQKISDALPKDMWVTTVQASSFKKSRVYATLNGYRWDHFNAYVFVSEDYGNTWKQLGKDLPKEPVNVILEDPHAEDLLYVGTDHGLYVSIDRGENFMAMDGGLPAVAVHDVVVHPGAKDLVVGTHGRSIYVGNVEELELLASAEFDLAGLHLSELEAVKHRSSWGGSWSQWREPNIPEVKLPVYSPKGGTARLTVTTENGTEVMGRDLELEKGLNYPVYNLDVDPEQANEYWKELTENSDSEKLPEDFEAGDNGVYYLMPGTYTVKMSLGDAASEQMLEVKE